MLSKIANGFQDNDSVSKELYASVDRVLMFSSLLIGNCAAGTTTGADKSLVKLGNGEASKLRSSTSSLTSALNTAPPSSSCPPLQMHVEVP